MSAAGEHPASLEALDVAAEAATAELEQVEPGPWTKDAARRGEAAPWADVAVSAEQAVTALREAAIAALFPERVWPVGADLWADLERWAATARRNGASLARIHAMAIEDHAELATLIRTALVLETLRSDADPRQIHAFVAGVAERCVDDPDLKDAAQIVLATVPGLERRCAVAVRRCEAKAESRSRSELAAWFRVHVLADRPVQIGRERFEGSAIAERIDEGDEEFIDLARHYWLHHPAGGGATTGGQRIFA